MACTDIRITPEQNLAQRKTQIGEAMAQPAEPAPRAR